MKCAKAHREQAKVYQGTEDPVWNKGVARVCGWPQGSGPWRKRNRSTQHREVDGKEVTRLVKGKEREERQLWARMVSGKSEEEKNGFET